MNEINLKNIYNEGKKSLLQIGAITLIIFLLAFLTQDLFLKYYMKSNNEYKYSLKIKHQNIIQSMAKCFDNFFSVGICNNDFFYKKAFRVLSKDYYIFNDLEYLNSLFLKNKLIYLHLKVLKQNKPYDDLSQNQILHIDFLFETLKDTKSDSSDINDSINSAMREFSDYLSEFFMIHVKNEVLSYLIERQSFLKHDYHLSKNINKNSPIINSKETFISEIIVKSEQYINELNEIKKVIDDIDERIKIFNDIVYFEYYDGELLIDNQNNSFNLLTFFYLIFLVSLFFNLLYLSIKVAYKQK